MPYANNFGEVGAHTYREQVLAVFGNPALHHLGKLLPASRRGKRGRRAIYPPLLQFAVAITARVYGSQRRALKELADETLWEEACAVFAEQMATPAPLPAEPPSARQQDGFITWLANQDGLLDRLSDAFTEAAVKQATYLGNFSAGGWPDYAHPDIWHTIFGDGTYLPPLSDATIAEDPVTGEQVLLGSRAGSPERARVQQVLTDPTEDQKKARGVNHVTLSTWTRYGWVVLGVRQSLSAEVHEARDLIASVHDYLGSHLHTVVWDRVIKGRDFQDFMSARRLLLVTKPVERGSHSRQSDGVTAALLTSKDALRLYERGAPLPLGTCVYPRSTDKGPEVTRSYYYQYETLTDGECAHDLWVDDGALVEVVEARNGWLVKTQHAEVLHARPQPGPRFTLDYKFRLPCAHAPGGHHDFHRPWEPRPSRPAKGPGRAAYDLRPVPRLSREAFAAIHGLRNITESFNSWFKSSLGEHKRAMRVEVDCQRVDHLCAAMLANACTWARYEATQLDDYSAAA